MEMKSEETIEQKVAEGEKPAEADKSVEPNKSAETDKPVKKKWLFKAVLGLTGCLLAGAYIAIAVYYSTRFFPGTVINGIDYSNTGVSSVMAVLMTERRDYRLEVTGRDPSTGEESILAAILAEDVELKNSVGEADVEELLARQNAWLWPTALWNKRHEYTLTGSVSFDEDKLTAFLDEIPAFQTKNMRKPQDAYIKGYSETEQRYVIEPEVSGTKLDMEAVRNAVGDAIGQGLNSLDLEEQGCYIEPAVTTENADLQKKLLQVNKCLEAEITYDWNGNEVILDGEQIKDWLSLENGEAEIDAEAVAEFVAKNAKKFDTYGKNRNFITSMGIELNLPSGAFGWKTDREAETEALIGLIKEGTVGAREPIYVFKGAWKGINDIGNTYVEADMTHQHLYLYQGGELKLETDFVSGNMSNGCATPPGVFGLTYKTTNAVLRGADYETPVNYWMPFNGNVGMHDATWRNAFGGDIYLTGGSHGCLNLPLDKAAEIYSYMTEGFPIICYYYPPEVLTAPPEEMPEGNVSE